MTYTYIPKGVCSRKMTVELNDDHTIQAVRVEGGCNGNLQGISRLVVGYRRDRYLSHFGERFIELTQQALQG